MAAKVIMQRDPKREQIQNAAIKGGRKKREETGKAGTVVN